MIIGAVIGDVVGSRFEFDRGPWTKDFELFTDECSFTDDTVMTLAVANALTLVGQEISEDGVKTTVIERMKQWGRAYPDAGYGVMFSQWLRQENPQPYNSFGNGSAMRTSAVGWMYDDLDTTRQVAKWVSEVSHDHPEGIKGADCTATVIWLARNGYDKDYIRDAVVELFDYDIDESLDSMRARHRHDETCQDSMPKALVSFLEAESFEDTIRNAVSLGGDTDTIAAIAGSMAEAYYGVPENLIIQCLDHLPDFIGGFVFSLETKIGK